MHIIYIWHGIILPSYIRIMIRHCKDPVTMNQSVWLMECQDFVAQLRSVLQIVLRIVWLAARYQFLGRSAVKRLKDANGMAFFRVFFFMKHSKTYGLAIGCELYPLLTEIRSYHKASNHHPVDVVSTKKSKSTHPIHQSAFHQSIPSSIPPKKSRDHHPQCEPPPCRAVLRLRCWVPACCWWTSPRLCLGPWRVVPMQWRWRKTGLVRGQGGMMVKPHTETKNNHGFLEVFQTINKNSPLDVVFSL